MNRYPPKPKTPFLSDPILWLGWWGHIAITGIGYGILWIIDVIKESIRWRKTTKANELQQQRARLENIQNASQGCHFCGGLPIKGTHTERNSGVQVIGCGLFLFFAVGAVLALISIIGFIYAPIFAIIAFGCLLLGAKRRRVWKCASCGTVLADR